MIKFNFSLYALLCIFSHPQICMGRSVHRTPDPNLPSITVYDLSEPEKKYTLRDSHIRKFPLFEAYNEAYLSQKTLPTGDINYRYSPKQMVSGSHLSELMEELIEEILAGKAVFKNFTILKRKDFDFERKCGLIILKFKNHPFVIKLFIERPQTVVRPYSKGLFPMGMFMTGGTNRHFNGFTRIKNLENLQTQIMACPAWADKITFPRKWFWTPKSAHWIEVVGTQVGHENPKNKFPACYAIVADEILLAKDQSSKTTRDIMDLCSCLEFTIDPHFNNFVIEEGTGLLAIYDTEHFPTLIGKYGTKFQKTEKYPGWYARLSRKFMKERLFSSKHRRLKRQLPGSIYPLY